MARLRQLYADQGWELSRNELPDYLPAICEFCSLADQQLQAALLNEALPILRRLAQRLEDRGSPYSVLLARLVELATSDQAVTPAEAASPSPEETESGLDEPAADDWDALDRQWEDSPVTFGVGAAHDSCNVKSDLIRPSRLTRPGRGTSADQKGGLG
jgi:nitrate reductase delta subunit